MKVEASELEPGDEVHYNPRTSWVVESLEACGEKTLRVYGKYSRWAWQDGHDRTGEDMSHRFYKRTTLEVTRHGKA